MQLDKKTVKMVELYVKTLQGETGTRFEDIDDLVSECLLRLLEQGDKWKDDGATFKTFAYRLVRNHLVNYSTFWRRKKRDRRKEILAGMPTRDEWDDTFGVVYLSNPYGYVPWNLGLGVPQMLDHDDPLEWMCASEIDEDSRKKLKKKYGYTEINQEVLDAIL